ncbi:hypothetical protein N7462_009320 [Penicillium macrosclerotiorum]|uniref:uncharacterized protein n=1 Tax=Penicillium macrosclerotiorum TaxID=303699 RepID=UPI00254711AE|nr:uncharacterized protein N7462_009320 [Penicillium macrosclerotiorum]KAJ5673881.1 hypothetical protein N7462_009320 [Penicillium macrosclerotiorum]
MAAAAQPRPYRRILTSALHRRFVHASALSLLVSYIVAIAIGDKTSFIWAWFPIGACGLRAILLFVSSLSIFVLRVGQMHLGPRTTTSPIGAFKHLFPVQVAQTFGWYLFSAWWFTEIYLWSSSKDAHLEMVKWGRPYERPTLNERPIYIHTYHLLLACVQAGFHLYYDEDQVPVPINTRNPKADDERTHPVPPTSKHIQNTLPQVVISGLKRSLVVASITPILYRGFLRQRAWRWSLYFAKLFWNFSRSSAEPDTFLPPGFFTLLVRSAFSGSLLILCWQTANLFFSIFIGKEPLKRGQPLTAEAKDPNGSLLTGLKTKKQVVKSFALWELGLISQSHPERRKTIFNEIDRDNGSTWTQVLDSLTEVIKGITTRIDAVKAPRPGAKPPSDSEPSQPILQTLPRLTEPPKNGNIFAAAPKASSHQDKFGEAFSSTAKAYGQSPDWTPKARARAREVLDMASSAMLSPERKQRLLASTEEFKLLTGGPSTTYKPEDVNPLIANFLRSPIGQPLRQTYARQASSVILSTPDSVLDPIVDAVDSLTRLLIASLAEDQYGKVQADVPAVVRLFTQTIISLDAVVHQGGLDAHWTDVNFPPSSDPKAQAEARKVPAVELVLDTLKSGLGDLLIAFKPYFRDIGLVGKDLRLAKQAAGLDEEDVSL